MFYLSDDERIEQARREGSLSTTLAGGRGGSIELSGRQQRAARSGVQIVRDVNTGRQVVQNGGKAASGSGRRGMGVVRAHLHVATHQNAERVIFFSSMDHGKVCVADLFARRHGEPKGRVERLVQSQRLRSKLGGQNMKALDQAPRRCCSRGGE